MSDRNRAAQWPTGRRRYFAALAEACGRERKNVRAYDNEGKAEI